MQRDASGAEFPLAFCKGSFSSTQLQYSITEKELYPIIKTLLKFQCITTTHQTSIIVRPDNRNLMYDLNSPKTTEIATLNRVYRLILLLQGFNLKVRLISGVKILLADFLSRWEYSALDRNQELTKKNEQQQFPDTVESMLAISSSC